MTPAVLAFIVFVAFAIPVMFWGLRSFRRSHLPTPEGVRVAHDLINRLTALSLKAEHIRFVLGRSEASPTSNQCRELAEQIQADVMGIQATLRKEFGEIPDGLD